MSVTAPETEARLALKTILDTEFAPMVTENDYLHASVGSDGPRMAVSPDNYMPTYRDKYVADTTLTVQFFLEWDKEINNEQSVDPIAIETCAERFRRALEGSERIGTGRVWYFSLVRLYYENDPTANKTRFTATVTAKGNNSELVETTG